MIDLYTNAELTPLVKNKENLDLDKIPWDNKICEDLHKELTTIVLKKMHEFIWTEEFCINIIKYMPEICRKDMSMFMWTKKTTEAVIDYLPELIENHKTKFIYSNFYNKDMLEELVLENLEIDIHKIQWTEETCLNILDYLPKLVEENINRFIWTEETCKKLIVKPDMKNIINQNIEKFIWTEDTSIYLIEKHPYILKNNIDKFIWSEDTVLALICADDPNLWRNVLRENTKNIIWTEEIIYWGLEYFYEFIEENFENFIWSERTSTQLLENLRHLCDMDKFILTKNSSITLTVFLPKTAENHIDKLVWSSELGEILVKTLSPQVIKNNLNKFTWTEKTINLLSNRNPELLPIKNKEFREVFYNIEKYEGISPEKFKKEAILNKI